MNNIYRFLKLALAISLILIMVVVLKPYVPNNMDEYSLYHTLACNYYPNNKLNYFRTGCNVYDLKLPFTNVYLPIREFGYMGSILSLYLAPFFIFFPDPMITRIVGLLFIIIQSFLISKLVKQKWFTIFIGMFIFFPYFFQHYADTGTVAIQITLLLFALYELQLWFSKQSLKYLLLAAIISFIGIFAKLTFIWYIPSLILYFIANIIKLKKVPYQQLIISSLVFSILIIVLFSSIDRNGYPYFQEFFIDNSKASYFHSDIFRALLNPYQAAQLIFEIGKPSVVATLYSVIMLGFSPFMFIWIFLRRNFLVVESMLWYGMFILTVIIISFVGKAWSIHHVVLAYPYLILSFLTVVSHFKKLIPKYLLVLLGLVFILFNLYLFLTFKNFRVQKGNEQIREPINSMLANPKLANEYIYVVVDWGMYYYQSLFGDKEQTVVYIEPFSELNQVNRLRSIRTNNNKKLLFIYNQKGEETDLKFIHDNFNVEDCQRFEYSNSWKILIEPGATSSLCNEM